MFHLIKTLFPSIMSFFGENGPRKMAEQSSQIKQYLQGGISENTNLNQVITQR